jgi:8-oxo-dGTP pyrophosphatase MutT (NUDIX family)
MIYPTLPAHFQSRFSVAACFVEYAGSILLLHRNDEANAWGLPAGSIENGESPIEAAMRELVEETGYMAVQEDIIPLGTTFVRGSQFDYTFSLFKVSLDDPIDVRIDEHEHTGYRWVTPHEALSLSFIEDLDSYLRLHYGDRLATDAT